MAYREKQEHSFEELHAKKNAVYQDFLNKSETRRKIILEALNIKDKNIFLKLFENMIKTYCNQWNVSLCADEPFKIYKDCCRVMCDYSAEGIWDCDYDEDDGCYSHILSAELTNALLQWNAWYELLNINDDNGKDFENEFELFNETGKLLAYFVKLETKDCKVLFFNELEERGYYEVIIGENSELILAPAEW